MISIFSFVLKISMVFNILLLKVLLLHHIFPSLLGQLVSTITSSSGQSITEKHPRGNLQVSKVNVYYVKFQLTTSTIPPQCPSHCYFSPSMFPFQNVVLIVIERFSNGFLLKLFEHIHSFSFVTDKALVTKIMVSKQKWW